MLRLAADMGDEWAETSTMEAWTLGKRPGLPCWWLGIRVRGRGDASGLPDWVGLANSTL